MYLRHTTVTKNGKTDTYWRLVRSVRLGNKVRQETVAQLGELDAQCGPELVLAVQALVIEGREGPNEIWDTTNCFSAFVHRPPYRR